MHISFIKTVSALALLASMSVVPVTQAHAQNANASPRGQEMGQGAENSQNAGTVGAEASGNANAGPGNNAAGETSSENGDQTAGPEEGHTCGGAGHIDNDAPGHQHDDCEAEAEGEAGATATGAAGGQAIGTMPVAQPGGGASGAALDCNTAHETLVPIFGQLTEEESAQVAVAESAALVPVACAAVTSDEAAQRALENNPALISALSTQGYSVSQVITVDAGEVPTIYVQATAE